MTIHTKNMAKQRGFTFIELIVVILLLGLLAAVALPRMLDVTDDAQIVSLEGVAGGFTTALAIAHAQWAAEGHSRGAPTAAASKVQINLDGSLMYMNENGWPANTTQSEDASEDSQTALECLEIWVAILQSAPLATIDPNDRRGHRYFISVEDNNPDVCVYEMIINNDAGAQATHYFEYELTNGRVTVFRPQEQ